MPTNLISTAATAANSSDVVVGAGESIVLSLKTPAVGAEVYIDIKDDAAAYHSVGRLTASDPAKVLTGPATYRARRIAGASCGVFSG